MLHPSVEQGGQPMLRTAAGVKGHWKRRMAAGCGDTNLRPHPRQRSSVDSVRCDRKATNCCSSWADLASKLAASCACFDVPAAGVPARAAGGAGSVHSRDACAVEGGERTEGEPARVSAPPLPAPSHDGWAPAPAMAALRATSCVALDPAAAPCPAPSIIDCDGGPLTTACANEMT